MSYLKQLIEQRKGVSASIDIIRKEWKGKEGAMPPEVEEKLDKALTDFDDLTGKIDREEKAERFDQWSREADDQIEHRGVENAGGERKGEKDPRETAFVKSLLRGSPIAQSFTDAEKKAMQADDWQRGGVLVAPPTFVANVIKNLDDELFIRRIATVYPNVGAGGLGAPTLTSDVADFEWTSEIGTSNETEALLGDREVKPHELKKAILISYKLLRNSRIDFEAFVRGRIAYKFARPQEYAFLLGTGVNQPLGVFTPSNDGVSTGRDVTAAAANALTGDDFVDALFNLKGQYQNRATWILHRAVVKAVRKLKAAGTGEYIWQPEDSAGRSMIGGAPGQILGRPYYMSELAPSSIAASQYVAVVGDFSQYWIADGEEMRVQVLNELYARTSQVGYHVEGSTDGAPVLDEAFSRLIMHS